MNCDQYMCRVCGTKFYDEKELGVCPDCGGTYLLLVSAKLDDEGDKYEAYIPNTSKEDMRKK